MDKEVNELKIDIDDEIKVNNVELDKELKNNKGLYKQIKVKDNSFTFNYSRSNFIW